MTAPSMDQGQSAPTAPHPPRAAPRRPLHGEGIPPPLPIRGRTPFPRRSVAPGHGDPTGSATRLRPGNDLTRLLRWPRWPRKRRRRRRRHGRRLDLPERDDHARGVPGADRPCHVVQDPRCRLRPPLRKSRPRRRRRRRPPSARAGGRVGPDPEPVARPLRGRRGPRRRHRLRARRLPRHRPQPDDGQQRRDADDEKPRPVSPEQARERGGEREGTTPPDSFPLPALRSPHTTYRPSRRNGSPSTSIAPPSRRSQIRSQWTAERFTLPVSG